MVGDSAISGDKPVNVQWGEIHSCRGMYGDVWVCDGIGLGVVKWNGRVEWGGGGMMIADDDEDWLLLMWRGDEGLKMG